MWSHEKIFVNGEGIIFQVQELIKQIIVKYEMCNKKKKWKCYRSPEGKWPNIAEQGVKMMLKLLLEDEEAPSTHTWYSVGIYYIS